MHMHVKQCHASLKRRRSTAGIACLGGLPTSLDISRSGLTGTLPGDAALWQALASLALFSVAGNSLQARAATQSHTLATQA
jgi:hypothetical protein